MIAAEDDYVITLLFYVRKYAKVFWERKDELQDIDRITNIIEEGRFSVRRTSRRPWMPRWRGIAHPYTSCKNYAEEEDRFLVRTNDIHNAFTLWLIVVEHC